MLLVIDQILSCFYFELMRQKYHKFFKFSADQEHDNMNPALMVGSVDETGQSIDGAPSQNEENEH